MVAEVPIDLDGCRRIGLRRPRRPQRRPGTATLVPRIRHLLRLEHVEQAGVVLLAKARRMCFSGPACYQPGVVTSDPRQRGLAPGKLRDPQLGSDGGSGRCTAMTLTS